MICSTCGRDTDNNLDFCVYCGSPLVKPEGELETTVMADPQSLPHAAPSVPNFNSAPVAPAAPVSNSDAAQEGMLAQYEGSAKTAFILSIISMALGVYVIGAIFSFIVKGKLGSISDLQFNFADPALNARYQSALKKANLAKKFSNIGLYISIGMVGVYIISFFFGFVLGMVGASGF